jgi:translation initiation factor 5A
VPIVTKKEYEVADVSEDEFASLINDDGSLKENLKLPKEDEEVYNELRKCWDEKGESSCFFTVISACGQEKIISARTKV